MAPKKKWEWQRKQKREGHRQNKKFSQLLDWLDDKDDEEHGGGVVVRTGVNHVTGGKNYSTILKLKADTMKKKIKLKSYSRRSNKYLRRPSYEWLPGPNFLHRSILLYNHSQFLLKILLF